jgi:hypothetical protein
MKKKFYLSLITLMMVGVFATSLSSCGDDDDVLGGSAIVGTWVIHAYGNNIAFKITSDAKLYYGEGHSIEELDFSRMKVPFNVSVTPTTFRMTHSMEPDYYEVYEYEISEDGNSIYISQVESDGGAMLLNGKYSRL